MKYVLILWMLHFNSNFSGPYTYVSVVKSEKPMSFELCEKARIRISAKMENVIMAKCEVVE